MPKLKIKKGDNVVVISGRDTSAVDAIHAFLRFHEAEHRALESGGH